MPSRTRIAREYGELIAEVTNGAVALTTYSPGDGVTRYRLGTSSAPDGRHDYFGDDSLAVAAGAAEAVRMCQAFLAGYEYADALREHVEPAAVYVYVSYSEGHEPAETSEPYATFRECAEAMLYAYADFPNIDSIDVEYDGDTIVSAAIAFRGGWYVQVQELDL